MGIILIVFCVNIVWAVYNWKNEFDLIKAVYENFSIRSVNSMHFFAPLYFISDLAITGTATSIFGFAGFYGSAMAIFMSNVLSVVFFTPRGETKQLLKDYRIRQKK